MRTPKGGGGKIQFVPKLDDDERSILPEATRDESGQERLP